MEDGIFAAIPKDLIDAAGDLIVGSAADTAVRLARGSALQVLRVNAAGTNLEYASPVAASEMAFAQITSNVSITATTEATANTAITLPATAFDGSTKVKLEVWTPHFKTPGSSARMVAVLYDGSSSIGLLGEGVDAGTGCAQPFMHVFTPANATKTYSIRCFVSSGTGTFVAGVGGSGAYLPAFARISRA